MPAVIAALWAAPFIHYGSTKRTMSATNAVCVADGGAGRHAPLDVQTNGIQDGAVDGERESNSVGRDVPVAPPSAAASNAVRSAGSASSGGLVAQSADAAATATAADAQKRVPPESGGRFRTTLHSASNDLARPDGVELFDRWRLRGAADDAFRIAPHGWWLRLPDGFADGVTVFSRGEIRPDARTAYFPPIFTNRVSILPQSRWHLIGAAAESGVWHALTPSNSLLVGWANAALGRDPSTPTNAVVELFRDGRFAYRYADCTAERSPVFPFDLDGDGLENSVDPDPLVANKDAHGTNAEWHLAVCSNVFEVAHENVEGETARGDARPLANGIFIPEGVAWRDGVNTNAYYFVDVVAERGPAPVYFVADRGSRLGSPVVVALADETNRVPLLMGVKYAVTSEVPISVSVPADAELDAAGRDAPPYRSCLSIARRSQTEYDVEWPIGFTFTEAVSGSERTYSVGVVPYDPGGDFEWGGSGGIAVMSLASSVSCQCASGDGRTLSFACSMGCPCGGGCSVFGRYSLEGAYFAVTGGVCRCGFDDEEKYGRCHCVEGDVCSCNGACRCGERNEGPYLSVSFSRDAVIFEEAYENSPGELRPRRSTRTTLSVAANGGPRGGRLTLTTKNLDRLAAAVNGPLCLPPSTTLGPFETYSAEFICEARTESDGADDVKVDGEFVEDETGSLLCKSDSLTVTKISLYPKITIGNCLYRHQWGVWEEVCCEWSPPSSTLRILMSDGCVETESYANRKDFSCPFKADSGILRISDGAVAYMPITSVVEPTGIKACNAEELDFAVPAGIPGGVGFCMDLHMTPSSVSFQNIECMERPSENGVVEGYFARPLFSAVWHHTEERGAGVWHRIQGDNFWFRDEAAMGDELPLPCTVGRIVWEIPVVWKGRDAADESAMQMAIVPQEFSISPSGTVRVSKHQYWAERTLDGKRNRSKGMR